MSADYYEFQEYLKLSVLAHDKIRVVTPVIFCTHVPNLEKRFSAEEKRFSNSVPLQNELKKLGLEPRPFWHYFLYVDDELHLLVRRRVNYAPDTVAELLHQIAEGEISLTKEGRKVNLDPALLKHFLKQEESASSLLCKMAKKQVISFATYSANNLRSLRIKTFVKLFDIFFLSIRGMKQRPWRIYARMLSLAGLFNLDIFLSKFPTVVRAQERETLDGVGKYISRIMDKA